MNFLDSREKICKYSGSYKIHDQLMVLKHFKSTGIFLHVYNKNKFSNTDNHGFQTKVRKKHLFASVSGVNVVSLQQTG